jgi:hypothetical protein
MDVLKSICLKSHFGQVGQGGGGGGETKGRSFFPIKKCDFL